MFRDALDIFVQIIAVTFVGFFISLPVFGSVMIFCWNMPWGIASLALTVPLSVGILSAVIAWDENHGE
jgi:hypothetical protein